MVTSRPIEIRLACIHVRDGISEVGQVGVLGGILLTWTTGLEKGQAL